MTIVMNRKEQLLSIALRLFAEKGYSETSIQDIATAARVTKGSLYYHFKSKEDILETLQEQVINESLRMLAESIRSETSPKERLISVIRTIVCNVECYQSYVTVFFEARRLLSPDKARLSIQWRHTYEDTVRKILIEGMKTGEFRRDLDIKVILMAIFGMNLWMYTWYNPSGRLSGEEIAEIFAKLVVEGLDCTKPNGQIVAKLNAQHGERDNVKEFQLSADITKCVARDGDFTLS